MMPCDHGFAGSSSGLHRTRTLCCNILGVICPFTDAGDQPDSELDIALVTETWPPEINGVAMTLQRLVSGLRRRAHRVRVVRPRQATEAGSDDDEILAPGVPLPHIATEGPLGASALNAAHRLAIPVSSTYHTNFDDYARHYRIGWLRAPVESWLRRFHNGADITMVPSPDQLQRLKDNGFQRLALLPRGVDTTVFSPAHRDLALRRSWGAADGSLVALHVGRVAPEKDIPLAIAAFQALRRVHPEASLVIAGDGPQRRALEKAHPGIVFTGALSLDDLARHYASADLFLFPSLSETFGNVLMEAMASGVCAVAYDYAAARLHLRHEENGLAVRCGDREGFIAGAVRAAGDPALRVRLSTAARTTAEGVAWSTVVGRFEELLHGVVAGARRSLLR
jgi:glycosyltransferase involved in cell wall biosynthesis